MEVDKLLHMTGVNHKSSYSENSNVQNVVIEASKPVIESSLRELIISSSKQQIPKCINVADLGCSSGPNAFLAIKDIIPMVIQICQEINQEPPAFQLFLNDLVGNDFNGIFKSLPGFYELQKGINGGRSPCFVTATPGSFYGRLFPEESIHFVHSCFSLHWLSQVPRGLVSESGEQLNKKNISWAKSSSPPSVHTAYSEQYKKDFTLFLKLRFKEMAASGKLVLVFLCNNEVEEGPDLTELLGITIHDLVQEGLIEKDKLETFNIPLYFPTIEEIRDIIETEGSFKIRHVERVTRSFNTEYLVNGQKAKFKGDYIASSQRAVSEPILTSHFGGSIMDDLFIKYGKNVSELIEIDRCHINTALISLSKE